MSDKPAGAISENWILDHVLIVQRLLSVAYFIWLISLFDFDSADPLTSLARCTSLIRLTTGP